MMKGDHLTHRNPINIGRNTKYNGFIRSQSMPKQPNYNDKMYDKVIPSPVNRNKIDTIYTSQIPIDNQWAPQTLINPHKVKDQFSQPHKKVNNTHEMEYQSIFRSYELKIRAMTDQHMRNKQQMQQKFKDLSREKNHWQNLATRLGAPHINQKSLEDFIQNSQITKHKQIVSKLEQQKNSLSKERQQLQKEINKMNSENYKLRQNIIQLNCKAENSGNNWQKMPLGMLSEKNKNDICPNCMNQSSINIKIPPNNSHHPKSSPHHSNKPIPQNKNKANQESAEHPQQLCIKLNSLVNSLNEKLVQKQLQQLNKKYAEKSVNKIKVYGRNQN